MSSPKVVIIAGPNGAGKTTFARAFLRQEAQCSRLINADLIAAGLSPLAPEAAAIKAGRQGGHDIPEVVIRRRSISGRRNFDSHYRAAVDASALYQAGVR